MKKILALIIINFCLTTMSFAQSYTFTKTMYSVYAYGAKDEWKDSPNHLKVENLGEGKYRIGVKEGGSGKFSNIYVKYLTYKPNAYSYKPYYNDDANMYSTVTLVGTDVKLSDMANGKPGIVVIYFDPVDVGAALKCIR